MSTTRAETVASASSLAHRYDQLATVLAQFEALVEAAEGEVTHEAQALLDQITWNEPGLVDDAWVYLKWQQVHEKALREEADAFAERARLAAQRGARVKEAILKYMQKMEVPSLRGRLGVLRVQQNSGRPIEILVAPEQWPEGYEHMLRRTVEVDKASVKDCMAEAEVDRITYQGTILARMGESGVHLRLG